MAANAHAQTFLPLVTCGAFIVGLSSSPSKSDPFSMDPFQSTFPSSKVSMNFLGIFPPCTLLVDFVLLQVVS